MRITEVAWVWWAEVYLGLVKWVGDLVGEHTCRETRYDFLDLKQIRGM